MLHEVLLALSGHPSPLFDESLESGERSDDNGTISSLLSPSEKSLLVPLGELSRLHGLLRRHLEKVASDHPSIVCRAVANSIRQVHFARFQQRILEVESKILNNDAGIVGAYNIVPLASIVGEFDDWQRRMAWYWELATFMAPTSAKSIHTTLCTGAALIDRLRREAHTGFLDLEETAMELSRIAETAWLRQACAWILHGNLPSHGASDFFLRIEHASDSQETHFRKVIELLPEFVSDSSANSILFIGRCLRHIRRNAQDGEHAISSSTTTQLSSTHMKLLSSLSLPIQATQLSRAISTIRQSVSQNVLQHLLPTAKTVQMLFCLHQYFLLNNGEFAHCLINEAESRLEARWQSMGRLLRQDPYKALQGLSINDAELDQTLSQIWRVLASREDDEDEDAVQDFARKHVSLSDPRKHRPAFSDSIGTTTSRLSPISFNDLLFPSATSLRIEVPPPMDLILPQSETNTYSAINSYLLSIRRGQLRLGDLWRRTSARRRHPAPPNPRLSNSESGRKSITEARIRAGQRAVGLRKVWATCSAALFLLSETTAYFEGEIIQPSWETFEKWIVKPQDYTNSTDDSGVLPDLESSVQRTQQDPETLSSGHRAFITALVYALLLTDVTYTKELRSLLGNIDQLVAHFAQLLDVQQKADLTSDTEQPNDQLQIEERKTVLDLDRARKKVDSDLKSVVGRLRQLDRERIGPGRYQDLTGIETGGFEPWRCGGVDRLLMKLEFGRVSEEAFDLP